MPPKKQTKVKDRNEVVSRTFLEDLAKTIYNPKTKQILKLCTGTLQNGPDPDDKKRPMHCGLGELYFWMTGVQPDESHLIGHPNIDESGVIKLAWERSTFKLEEDANRERGLKIIESLGELAPLWMIDEFKNKFRDGFGDESKEHKFRALLDGIPGTNDETDDDEYVERSKAVAELLLQAAALLPKDKKQKPKKKPARRR